MCTAVLSSAIFSPSQRQLEILRERLLIRSVRRCFSPLRHFLSAIGRYPYSLTVDDRLNNGGDVTSGRWHSIEYEFCSVRGIAFAATTLVIFWVMGEIIRVL